ncbi:MAG: DUF4176 domain-containing protein [Clostridia bacterium]|nr:DUF4176 domain-containing protein [Clostridia bacterium]
MTVDKNLPIGTVVVLNDQQTKPVMINGYCMVTKDGMRDYAGVPYPLGLENDVQMVIFNAEAITEVLYEGMRANDYEMLVSLLDEQRAKAVEKLARKGAEGPAMLE